MTIELPKGKNNWQLIAEHFIECVLDGAACQSPLRHGLIVQEMLEAVLASAAKGREVRLNPAGS